MVDKAWKASERRMAKKFDTSRIPVSGSEGWDIETDQLVIEHKYGKSVMSAVLRGAIEQINACKDDRYPAVTFEQRMGPGKKNFTGVVMDVDDFVHLMDDMFHMNDVYFTMA